MNNNLFYSFLIEMERERALLEKWGGGGCFLDQG